MPQCVKKDLDTAQIASPAGARPGFERESPVCPVLARLGKLRDLTGIATGFERGPAGPAQTARLSFAIWEVKYSRY